MKTTLFTVTTLLFALLFLSCDNKDKERIAALEKEKAQLKLQKTQIESQKQEIESQRNQLQEQQKKEAAEQEAENKKPDILNNPLFSFS